MMAFEAARSQLLVQQLQAQQEPEGVDTDSPDAHGKGWWRRG
jgi:hypothetical protein